MILPFRALLPFSLLFSIGLLIPGCGGTMEKPSPSQSFPSIPSDGSVDLGNTRASYVVEGNGRPCMVIGSRIYYSKTFSDSFKARFRCVYLDLRGFIPGAPPPGSGSFGVAAAVEDIESSREQLGLDSPVIFGHSIHGLMAIAFAQKYPDRVSQVIAIGAPPVFDEDLQKASERFWEAEASQERIAINAQNLRRAGDLPDGWTTDAMVRRYVAFGAMYWFDPSFDASELWEEVEINPELSQQVFDPTNSFDLRDGPVPILTPVLLALGRYDFVVPYTMWDSYLDILPNHQRHIFSGSGHTPQFEQPELFLKVVVDWLDN